VVYHLGLAYHKKGELEQARTELTRALQLNSAFDGAGEAKRIITQIQ
jgi:Flp pilus assembly protein TadD